MWFIYHKNFGKVCLLSIEFALQKVIGYYHRSPVYSYLYGRKQMKKMYEDDVRARTMKQFSRFTFKISGIIVKRNGTEQTAWIVLPPFCCIQYIKDAR